jgi:hypothetical protein
VPYSIYAATAATAASAFSVSASNIVGAVKLAQLPVGVVLNNQNGIILGGTFSGNGIGLTNLLAASLIGTLPESLLSSNIARLNIPNTTIQATAAPVITAGFITGTTNLLGGSGYTTNPVVTITDVSGSNALITASVLNGVVTSLSVQSAGSHYSTAAMLTIAAPPSNAYQIFNSGNIFNGISTFNNSGNSFTGAFTGNGAGMTNLNLTGPTENAALGNEANGFQALASNTTGINNTANGWHALLNNSNGSGNTANGINALVDNVSGSRNTASGNLALGANSTGSFNTAYGVFALLNSQSGSTNIALGYYAGCNLINKNFNIDIGNQGVATDNGIIRIGDVQTQAFIAGVISGNGAGLTNVNLTGLSASSALGNEANGYQALAANTTGINNAANGQYALAANTNGNYNMADGYQALASNTSGSQNTASGIQALWYNTTGGQNTADGDDALGFNTTGGQNTATGYRALQNNTTASQNTASGWKALYNNTTGGNNLANGAGALESNTSGNYNIAEGYQAGYNITTGSSNIDIGNLGMSTDTNIIRIGSGQTQAFLAGNVLIGGATNAVERFEVDGTDTAFSPGCSIRIRNTFDPVGGFIGDGWQALQFGMYNPSASSVGVIPAGAKRSFFGFDQSGSVGSLANNFNSPSYRNLLDDGDGNMRISGVITGNGAGLTSLNPTNISSGTASINITGNAATATTAASVTGNIADTQLSANVPLMNGTNAFTGTNTFAGALTATNANNVISGTFTGSGAGLTNLSVTAITGGINTNLLIGGHTFFITNGIIMAIQ